MHNTTGAYFKRNKKLIALCVIKYVVQLFYLILNIFIFQRHSARCFLVPKTNVQRSSYNHVSEPNYKLPEPGFQKKHQVRMSTSYLSQHFSVRTLASFNLMIQIPSPLEPRFCLMTRGWKAMVFLKPAVNLGFKASTRNPCPGPAPTHITLGPQVKAHQPKDRHFLRLQQKVSNFLPLASHFTPKKKCFPRPFVKSLLSGVVGQGVLQADVHCGHFAQSVFGPHLFLSDPANRKILSVPQKVRFFSIHLCILQTCIYIMFF